MAKNSITDYSKTAASNTDIQSVDIDEGCLPSGINNAIREIMADLADMNDGTVSLTSPSFAAASLTGDLSFGDNDKAIFGAGSDLQIYHDGSNSFVKDAGTGNLQIQGNHLSLEDSTGTRFLLGLQGGETRIYNQGNEKLAATTTGIDVTGTVTADGLTVDGNATIQNTGNSYRTISLDANRTASVNTLGRLNYKWDGNEVVRLQATSGSDTTNKDNGSFTIFTSDDGTLDQRLKIDSNGDISFYEDTGTTAKFFWDASAEALGIGTSSPSANLHVSGSGARKIDITDTGGANTRISTANNNSYVGSTTNHPLLFITNDTERMRIDSSGRVGIGTSSPDKALTISASDSQVRLYDADGTNQFASFQSDNGTTKITSRNNTSHGTIAFQRYNGTTVAESMRIDSSGNVGIGTSSPVSPLEIATTNKLGSTFTGTTNGEGLTVTQTNYTAGNYVSLVEAAFDDSNDVNPNVRIGAMFDGSGANLAFGTSNSYGSGITNTAMFIDSSGNVGIGTSSPSNPLTVSSSDELVAKFASTDATGGIDIADNTSYTRITHSGGLFRIDANDDGSGSSTVFSVATAGTERMRIDSSGNVGIGTSSPARELEVTGSGNVYIKVSAPTANDSAGIELANTGATWLIQNDDTSSEALTFDRAGSEVMRIDSSGNLAIGKTASSGSTDNGHLIFASGVQYYFAAATTNINRFYNSTTGSLVGSITVYGSSVGYNTTSDYRLKENVTGITDGIERVKQLNPSRFNFIADADTTVDGFLAHEAQSVVPEAVHGEKDAVDADGNPEYQGIDQSKLVPLLTAALQEAITKIEDLESRVATLEGN